MWSNLWTRTTVVFGHILLWRYLWGLDCNRWDPEPEPEPSSSSLWFCLFFYNFSSKFNLLRESLQWETVTGLLTITEGNRSAANQWRSAAAQTGSLWMDGEHQEQQRQSLAALGRWNPLMPGHYSRRTPDTEVFHLLLHELMLKSWQTQEESAPGSNETFINERTRSPSIRVQSSDESTGGHSRFSFFVLWKSHAPALELQKCLIEDLITESDQSQSWNKPRLRIMMASGWMVEMMGGSYRTYVQHRQMDTSVSKHVALDLYFAAF